MLSKKWTLLIVIAFLVSMLAGACGPTTETPAASETPAVEPTAAAAEPSATAQPAAPTAADEPTTSPEPRVLRARLEHDIRTIDPAFHYSDIEEFAGSPVFNGLVVFGDETYDVVNDLAESIEMSEDGLTVDFKLKEGVQWHRGYGEVTTEDVKFSFERYAALDSAYAGDWSALDHVEVVDKYNGQIILKEPFAPLWTTTLPTPRGWILPKKYIEEVGQDVFATDPVGSGPYLWDEWKPAEEVILKRNPDYFGEPAAFDEMHLIVIEEAKSAEIALEAGELDFAYISIAGSDRFAASEELVTEIRPQLHYRWIGMNVENPKLQDENVRQAIRYAIDVPSIIQATYLGKVDQSFTLIPEGVLGAWTDAPQYQRDVEKAKEYLAKAGVTELELHMATQDTSEYRTWAEIAQQNLAEVGINLIVDTVDETTFWSLGEGDKGKELELFTMTYTSYPDPAWYTMWFTCDQVGVWNWMRWCSPEFDALHGEGMVTLDNAAREKLYVEAQQLWDQAVHTVWITFGSRIIVYDKDIVPSLTPHGQMRTRWFMPAE